MRLADFVLEYLRDIGVKQVFQVYGAATGDLVDAFSRVKGIDYICAIHEQGASFMAETQAKVTNHLQVAMATSGPGGLNLLDGVANCFYDSVPCLFITGQVNSKFMRKDVTQRQVGFQENDIVSMAKPITKYAEMLKSPSDIKKVLDQAVFHATSGRQGAVLIDIPIDMQKAEVDPEKLEGWRSPVLPHEVGKVKDEACKGIKELCNDLMEAKRPIILVGGGLWWANATEDVRRLGELLKIPFVRTWNAIDIATNDYPYYVGNVGTYGGEGRNFAIQNADLLITLGSRISGRLTGGHIESFARGAKKYIIDIEPGLLNREWQDVKGDVNICADAKEFIEVFGYAMRQMDIMKWPLVEWHQWLEQCREWKKKYPAVLPSYYEADYVHPYVFMKELSKQMKKGDVIVSDSGGNAVVTCQAFESKYGQRVLSSHGNSTMGYSFAGAMGLSFLPEYLKEEKGRVVCIIGDGGMQMNIQELQTMKHYGLRLKTFVLNNKKYGITTQFQQTNYGGRYLASCPQGGYSTPDFVKVAKAYGIKGVKLNAESNLSETIKTVLEMPEGCVCDVDIAEHTTYEPRIAGWTPIEDMSPLLPRKEFRENMIIEPVKGWDKVQKHDSSIGLA